MAIFIHKEETINIVGFTDNDKFFDPAFTEFLMDGAITVDNIETTAILSFICSTNAAMSDEYLRRFEMQAYSDDNTRIVARYSTKLVGSRNSAKLQRWYRARGYHIEIFNRHKYLVKDLTSPL